MKKILNLSLLTFLLFLYVFVSAQSYVTAVASNLSDAVFRLHVIANSDSDEDQALKIKVRDSLLDYMNEICSNCYTKEEAITLAQEHKKDFQEIAEKTILESGFNYSVKININNFYFPTKNYGDISLPAGLYDALRVEIGEAKGQNWWCVMFPSLCFIDISSGVVDDEAKENLEDNLEKESYSIISDNKKSNIKFKFKLIEFFAEKGLFTANKNM
ncbi:MAG: stage II sporulation protein R [Clostridia bacterium]|nr:stage II sporulation protein R [Clostridia bacterium]